MSRLTPKNRIPDMIKAAVQVFSRKGYRLTQMEEIAKGANISKATLYYYFKNKAHLFHYILENGVPEESEIPPPPPETASSTTEFDLLELLKRGEDEGCIIGIRPNFGVGTHLENGFPYFVLTQRIEDHR